MLRRGIEPIIATVILVAVALIIAVAVVGYLMGLFGGLSGGQPQITITNAVARNMSKGLQLELYISNAGAGSDRLLRVEIIHGGSTSTYYATGTFTGTAGMTVNATTVAAALMLVGGNSRGWLTITTGYNKAAPGDTIIIKLYFEKSGVQTLNVVVSP
ncbi:MAG: archaellin/type IV pilin N-terminal domain-containing protein [Sulfolobales archaeon]|nr:archaellin/type IV pilin N-terminal domain-containing protein [Sulfolobales archaeon]